MRKVQIVLLYMTIISFFLFNGQGIGGMAYWNYTLSIINIISIFKIIRNDLKFSGEKGYIDFVKLNILFIVIIFIVYLGNGVLLSFGKRLIQILNGFLLVISINQILITRSQINNVIKLLTGIVMISSLFGIGQYIYGGLFNSIWIYLQGSNLIYDIDNYSRVAGLSYSSIELSYQLCLLFPIILFKRMGATNYNKKKLLGTNIILIVIGITLILNQTRSAIIACLIVFAIWMFFLIKERSISVSSKVIFLSMLPVITIVGIKIVSHFEVQNRFKLNMENDGRGAIFLTAINYSLKNPLGTGIYLPTIDDVVGNVNSAFAEAIINMGTHNTILNVLVYYGYLGAFIYIYILYKVIKSGYRLVKSPNKEYAKDKFLFIGLLLSVLAYIFNGMFHNMGMYTGDFKIWLIIGLMYVFSNRLSKVNSMEDENCEDNVCGSKISY